MINIGANTPFWLEFFGQALAALLGAVAGALAGAWASYLVLRRLQRQDLLERQRLDLLLQLQPLMMNAAEFNKAAERIPVLYDRDSRPLQIYAYYYAELRYDALFSNAGRREVVDAIAVDLKGDYVRTNELESLATTYKAADPNHLLARISRG